MTEALTEVSFPVGADQAGQRLDRLVAEQLPEWSRAAIKRLFSSGRVHLVFADGRLRGATKGHGAVAGDRVIVDLTGLEPPRTDVPATPEPDASLSVVLERDDLVIVDKPAGQPSAPLDSGELGTVANALVARFPEMAAVGFRASEPGLCHRLDNDTSGLLLAARTPQAFERLTAALKAGRLRKRYLLLCEAQGLADTATIELQIAPHPRNSRRVIACRGPDDRLQPHSRPASTRFRVLQRQGELALVEARAPKALRHQLRAHFAAIGHPIVGDRLYGSTVAPELGRHALHASSISWSGDELVAAFQIRSSLPPALRSLFQ